MNKFIRSTLFIIGFAVTAILIIGISVYGFNDYDKMKGQGISFQIGLWLVIFYSVIVGSAFAVGTALFDAKFKKTLSFLIGILFAMLVLILPRATKILFTSARLQMSILAMFLFCGSFLLPPLLNYFSHGQGNDNQE